MKKSTSQLRILARKTIGSTDITLIYLDHYIDNVIEQIELLDNQVNLVSPKIIDSMKNLYFMIMIISISGYIKGGMIL